MKPIEDWQVLRRDEDVDASGDARVTADEAVTLEAEDHLVNRRRADAEMALHISLGRGLMKHSRIDIDEGQIAALLFGEAMRPDAARGA